MPNPAVNTSQITVWLPEGSEDVQLIVRDTRTNGEVLRYSLHGNGKVNIEVSRERLQQGTFMVYILKGTEVTDSQKLVIL
jgi:hypothetical protein